jgi:hypothetical protein
LIEPTNRNGQCISLLQFFTDGYRVLSQTRSNRILELFLTELLQSRGAASYRFLFLDQSTLKDRPRTKAGLIRPPETALVVISIFLNWQVNQ